MPTAHPLGLSPTQSTRPRTQGGRGWRDNVLPRGAWTVFIGLAVSCGGVSNDERGPISVSNDNFSVAADPPGGTFSGPITVALFSERPAALYYTTNGEAPADKGVEYTGPIEIEGDVMLNFAGVDENGVWSRSVVEYYDSRELTGIPSQAPRILSLSRPQLYFSARSGDGELEQTVYASSVGSEHVLIRKIGRAHV